MGERTRHLTHRDQAGGELSLLFLLRDELLILPALGDIGGNLQFCRETVSPDELTLADIKPLVFRQIVNDAGQSAG